MKRALFCQISNRHHHQMKMIVHQAIGMHLPAGLGAALAQGFQKKLAVLVILENRLPPISPVHDVINRAGILHSEFARHANDPYGGRDERQVVILQ